MLYNVKCTVLSPLNRLLACLKISGLGVNECKPEIFSHFILLSNAGNTDLVFHKNSLLTAAFRELPTQWMWNQVLVWFHLHTIKLGWDPWSQNFSFTLIKKNLCFRWATSNLWLKPNSMHGYSKTTASDSSTDDRVQKRFSENWQLQSKQTSAHSHATKTAVRLSDLVIIMNSRALAFADNVTFNCL